MRAFAPVLVFATLVFSAPAHADAAAVQRIEKFHDTLLAVMKQGEALGVSGRYKKLEPEIDALFDLAAMTRFTVGPQWTSMSEADRTSLTKAFRRMTVASYARNFDAFRGQKFTTDPKADRRGLDLLVKSQVLPAGEKPVNLVYRMREAGGAWQVIDVIYEFVSQLATRRSDFSSTLASGGAPALVKKLDEISDRLMKEPG